MSSVDADFVLASSYAAAVNSSKRGAIDDSVKGNRNETNNNNKMNTNNNNGDNNNINNNNNNINNNNNAVHISQKDDTPTVLSCMIDEPNHHQHQQLDMDHNGQGMNSA